MKIKLTKSLMVGAMLAALSALPLSAVTITASLVPSSNNITVGDSFSVQVFAQNVGAGDLAAFGFKLDPLNALTLMSFTGTTIGPNYFNAGSLFGAGPKDVIGAYTGLTHNADLNILLATLSFSATGVGTNTIFVQGLFDGIDMGLYYGDNTHPNVNADLNGSLVVSIKAAGGGGGNNVPDAGASIALLSMGLLSLASLRKFRARFC